MGAFVIGREFFLSIPEFDVNNLFRSYRALALLAYTLVIIPFWLVGWLHIFRDRTPPYSSQLSALAARIDGFPSYSRWILGALLAPLPTYFFLFSPFRFDPYTRTSHLTILVFSSLVISFLLSPSTNFPDYLKAAFSSLLLVFAIYLFGLHALTITSYPFSLTWSEGNRIWDYSILFGADRYVFLQDREIDPFIEPGRQFVWGLPFLFPRANIIFVRLWDTVVSVFPHLLLSVLVAFLVSKNQPVTRSQGVAFSFWGLLFLSQGPIFPNLILPVMVMILGLANKNILVASTLVGLSAYFSAGDRFHWGLGLPVLAALFSVLQISPDEPLGWRSYRRPLIVAFGGLLGLMIPTTNRLLALISQIDFAFFTISPGFILIAVFVFLLLLLLYLGGFWKPRRMHLRVLVISIFLIAGAFTLYAYVVQSSLVTQDLLWLRWFPNPTFRPGILLALLIAVGPIALVLFLARRRGHWHLGKVQVAVVLFVAVSLGAAGLVASAKIGGGGDLHNLDLFLIATLFVAAIGWPSIQRMLDMENERPGRLAALYLLLAVPVFYIAFFISGRSLRLPPESNIEAALQRIQTQVDAASPYGDILFMDQRQLLTFGHIHGVVLIDEYEKKQVMDLALSKDQEYFDQFYEDLANHRFSLIVSEKLFLRTEDAASSFSEENDAWVHWVSEPLLTYYKPIATINLVGVQLLVPRN